MKEKYIIKMEKEEWANILDKTFNKKKKDIKVDGFRKGNVPKEIYIKKFGIESLYMDATDEAIPILYKRFLEEHKDLEIVARPNVDIKSIDKKHLEVEFEVVLKPEVKLGKYKDLKVKKETPKVTKEEIEHELEHLKEHFVELKEKENFTAVSGDEAVIDFEGFKDGVPFEGGKGKDYHLVLGSHSFIPGFEEAVVGMTVGEEKEIPLKFPENYPAEDLKGKDVIFKVKLNKLNERVYPEMNEEFFKDLNMPEVDSEEKLRKEIENNIKTYKEKEIENNYTEECLSVALKNAKLEVPIEMIDEEVERMIDEFRQQVAMQGIKLEQYLEMMGSNIEELKKNFKDEANKRVSYRLIIEAVAKEENIVVSDKEIDEYALNLASRYGLEKDKFIEEIGGLEYVKLDLRMKKALELIIK